MFGGRRELPSSSLPMSGPCGSKRNHRSWSCLLSWSHWKKVKKMLQRFGGLSLTLFIWVERCHCVHSALCHLSPLLLLLRVLIWIRLSASGFTACRALRCRIFCTERGGQTERGQQQIDEHPASRRKTKHAKDQVPLTPLMKGRDMAGKLLKKKSNSGNLALTLQAVPYANELCKEMANFAQQFE